jgi:adenylylsulfate kinase-like enzyme
MIIIFFGQPHSGKSTLSKRLFGHLKSMYNKPSCHFIDNDRFRLLFKNQDYSREGRLRNLKLASDIAFYECSLNRYVLTSFVYPYKEARQYVESLGKQVKWIYLTYDPKEKRGREAFHCLDFEEPDEIDPEHILKLNTSDLTENEAFLEITKFLKF